MDTEARDAIVTKIKTATTALRSALCLRLRQPCGVPADVLEAWLTKIEADCTTLELTADHISNATCVDWDALVEIMEWEKALEAAVVTARLEAIQLV